MTEARTLIEAHGLEPHPEGGWYRETWRGPAPDGRATATMIHFLLEADQTLGQRLAALAACSSRIVEAGHVLVAAPPRGRAPFLPRRGLHLYQHQ